MEKEKKQNSSQVLKFGILAFAPIAMLFIAVLILYLTQPPHGRSLHSFGGLIGLFVYMSSVPIVPLTIVFSILAIKSKAKLTKSDQTIHDKRGFILAIVSCLIVVCHLILPFIN